MQVMLEHDETKSQKSFVRLNDALGWGKGEHESLYKVPLIAADDWYPLNLKTKVVNAFQSRTLENWNKPSLNSGSQVDYIVWSVLTQRRHQCQRDYSNLPMLVGFHRASSRIF